MHHPLAVPLQAAGLRQTFSRLEVLSQFCLAGDQASTGAEVYAGLTRRGVPMAYSTVYRMLQTLSYAGLLLPAGTHGAPPVLPAVIRRPERLASPAFTGFRGGSVRADFPIRLICIKPTSGRRHPDIKLN
jgi:hypothetical protein